MRRRPQKQNKKIKMAEFFFVVRELYKDDGVFVCSITKNIQRYDSVWLNNELKAPKLVFWKFNGDFVQIVGFIDEFYAIMDNFILKDCLDRNLFVRIPDINNVKELVTKHFPDSVEGEIFWKRKAVRSIELDELFPTIKPEIEFILQRTLKAFNKITV
jgi:hypothetical protein